MSDNYQRGRILIVLTTVHINNPLNKDIEEDKGNNGLQEEE
jgi:hypothetical protein